MLLKKIFILMKTLKSSISMDKKTIVLTKFPFTDLSSTKRRPAVISVCPQSQIKKRFVHELH